MVLPNLPCQVTRDNIAESGGSKAARYFATEKSVVLLVALEVTVHLQLSDVL